MYKLEIKYDLTSDIFNSKEEKLPTEIVIDEKNLESVKKTFETQYSVNIINTVNRTKEEYVLYGMDQCGTMFQCYVKLRNRNDINE